MSQENYYFTPLDAGVSVARPLPMTPGRFMASQISQPINEEGESRDSYDASGDVGSSPVAAVLVFTAGETNNSNSQSVLSPPNLCALFEMDSARSEEFIPPPPPLPQNTVVRGRASRQPMRSYPRQGVPHISALDIEHLPPMRHNPYLAEFEAADAIETEGLKRHPLPVTQSRYRTDFHQIDEIGSGAGSFGHVFRCRHRLDGGLYAVKTVRQTATDKKGTRLMNEVQVLTSIKPTDHIVRYYSSWEETPTLYIQTELCQRSVGSQLGAVVNFQLLSDKMILTVACHVARALEYMHGRGIVHLDIKPDNILEDFTGVYKLADFGLARRIGVKGDVEMGDSRYLSNDLLRETTTDLRRDDMFSLGATLLALARGANLESSGPLFHSIRSTHSEPNTNLVDGWGMQFRSRSLRQLVSLLLSTDLSCRPDAASVVKMSLSALVELESGAITAGSSKECRGLENLNSVDTKIVKSLSRADDLCISVVSSPMLLDQSLNLVVSPELDFSRSKLDESVVESQLVPEVLRFDSVGQDSPAKDKPQSQASMRQPTVNNVDSKPAVQTSSRLPKGEWCHLDDEISDEDGGEVAARSKPKRRLRELSKDPDFVSPKPKTKKKRMSEGRGGGPPQLASKEDDPIEIVGDRKRKAGAVVAVNIGLAHAAIRKGKPANHSIQCRNIDSFFGKKFVV